VTFTSYLPLTGVELDPVRHGGPADHADLVLGVAEEDGVADHVAVVIAGHDLLGLVRPEVLQRVDRDIGEQAPDVRALEIDVLHVEGLVEEDDGVLPGLLLVAPVGVFGLVGELVAADGRVAQHVNRAGILLEFGFEAGGFGRIHG
jgi:hypothetical protein